MRKLIAISLALIGLVATLGARAQDAYPSQNIRFVVPFTAGSATDTLARLLANRMSTTLGRNIVVENIAGGNGIPASQNVVRAAPDGYTVMVTSNTTHAGNQALLKKVPYDAVADFEPITKLGTITLALVGHPSVPAANVQELIAYAKANPGKLTSATQGNGTTSHLTSELFQMMADLKFQHVPYRGSAPALTDLVAGSVDLMFDNLGVSLPLVKGGQLKLLGVATPKRMASLPDVPTIAETLPGFESAAWFAIVAPPKTPQAVVDKINADVNEALRQSDIVQRLTQLSAEPIGGTPQATAAYMREEIERWHKVIKAANVKLD
jgi:tripartite-type tricarboxylate transporter receptor subunit TctC